MVAVPFIWVIDGVWFFRSINGDEGASTFVAFSVVENAIIAISESSLVSAIRAEGGRRDVELFVEGKVFGGGFKWGGAFGAIFHFLCVKGWRLTIDRILRVANITTWCWLTPITC